MENNGSIARLCIKERNSPTTASSLIPRIAPMRWIGFWRRFNATCDSTRPPHAAMTIRSTIKSISSIRAFSTTAYFGIKIPKTATPNRKKLKIRIAFPMKIMIFIVSFGTSTNAAISTTHSTSTGIILKKS